MVINQDQALTKFALGSKFVLAKAGATRSQAVEPNEKSLITTASSTNFSGEFSPSQLKFWG